MLDHSVDHRNASWLREPRRPTPEEPKEMVPAALLLCEARLATMQICQ
jgi:hypothetical protein